MSALVSSGMSKPLVRTRKRPCPRRRAAGREHQPERSHPSARAVLEVRKRSLQPLLIQTRAAPSECLREHSGSAASSPPSVVSRGLFKHPVELLLRDDKGLKDGIGCDLLDRQPHSRTYARPFVGPHHQLALKYLPA